jgi:Family of unknown function (DUF6188)
VGSDSHYPVRVFERQVAARSRLKTSTHLCASDAECTLKVCSHRLSTIRLMSEVGFLIGRPVVAVQGNPDETARIIFDLGDKPEPALYATVGACSYEDSSGVTRLLASMFDSVVSDTSTEGGTLVLSFSDGSLLRCEPDERYEAWQVVGGSPQYLVVCEPGGELAVYGTRRMSRRKPRRKRRSSVSGSYLAGTFRFARSPKTAESSLNRDRSLKTHQSRQTTAECPSVREDTQTSGRDSAQECPTSCGHS